jgi:acyl-coenzyme A synthetase/AMP-(fatty) acid ligase
MDPSELLYPADRPHHLQSLIAGSFEKYSFRPLLISDTDQCIYSYSEAKEIVDLIVSRFAASGIKKGDFICSYAPVHEESLFTFWAAALSGIIFVAVDYNWPVPQFLKVLEKVDPRLILCNNSRYRELSGKVGVPVIILDSPEGEAISGECRQFSDWLQKSPGKQVAYPAITPGDPGVILYTSGTTSEPKSVMHSHGALFRSGWLASKSFQFREDDILFSLGELNAMSGFRNPAIVPFFTGSSFLIASAEKRSNILTIVECIHNYKCTILGTAPALIHQLSRFSDRIPAGALQSLRIILSTGSTLFNAKLNNFYDSFSIPVYNYYGLTETAGICIGGPAESGAGHEMTLGLPIGARVDIVGEDGLLVETGKPGEIRIKSENLMIGYYKDTEQTSMMLRNGCIYTGDLGRIRSDGTVVLLGRKRDIIKDAYGDVISPGEIEDVLLKHPGILETAVCGYLDPSGIERWAAFIVPREPGTDYLPAFSELNRMITEQLGPRKVPHQYYSLVKLPRTPNGKIQKYLLIKEIENAKGIFS